MSVVSGHNYKQNRRWRMLHGSFISGRKRAGKYRGGIGTGGLKALGFTLCLHWLRSTSEAEGRFFESSNASKP